LEGIGQMHALHTGHIGRTRAPIRPKRSSEDVADIGEAVK